MSSEQDQALAQSLLSGEAWRTFCDELKAAGDLIISDQVPQSPLQRAEGFRYLTRVMRMGLEMVLEHGNPEAPQLWFQDETVKSGGDNPDNLYYWGRIRGSYSYRLKGVLAQPEYLTINIYAGGLNQPGLLRASRAAGKHPYPLCRSPNRWCRVNPGRRRRIGMVERACQAVCVVQAA